MLFNLFTDSDPCAHGIAPESEDQFTSVTMEQLESRLLMSALAWSAGPDLPGVRTDAVAVVTSDSAVRLLGGDAAAPTQAPLLTSSATAWTLGHNTDTQRNDLGGVVSGNSVFIFGGTGNTEGSDEVLNYDYRVGDSQDVAKMNRVRYDFGYAVDAREVPPI